MSKKTIKIGIAAALSGVVVSSGCGNVSSGCAASQADGPVTGSSALMDSLALEKRLLELSRDTVEVSLETGAMCYDISGPMPVDYTCAECGHVTREKYDTHIMYTVGSISEIVNQIKAMGYDVILDKSEFCSVCAKQEVGRPELVFKIRFSDNSKYHVAKSNIEDHYRCLLEFLLGKDVYPDFFDTEVLIRERIDVIQRMTGLGKDLKIER